MAKTCFDCGMEAETWTGPVFSSAIKLRDFYKNLGISDPVVKKMQDDDFLCSKCTGKAECRNALKCYNFYKEKWTPEQYEIWAKNNVNLISIAETELKEQEKKSETITRTTSITDTSYGTGINAEKLAIITGTIQNGQLDSTGQAIIHSELSKKFETFCASHIGKIIDWNPAQQSSSNNWFIFVRYTD